VGAVITDPATRCVLVSSDRELAASIVELVSRAPGAQLVTTLPAAQALARPPACDVLLVGDHPAAGPDGVRELGTAFAGAGIVLLSRDPDVHTYRDAMAAGVRAVVAIPPTPGRLIEAIGDAARVATGARATPPGRLVAVAGAVGGAGATALALARLGGGTLIDLAHGWAGPGRSCGGDTSIVDLARVGTALAESLDSVAGEAMPGVPLIPGPDDPELLELLPAGVGTSLAREVRRRWPLTVADVGRVTCAPARELAAAADTLLVVTTPDPRSAAAARSLVTKAAGWGTDASQTALVVNRHGGGSELSPGGVERAVGCTVAAVVRERRRAMRPYASNRVAPPLWPRGTPFAKLGGLARGEAGGR
jgi:flagellar biosynthesis protein FlhG